ncbi:MAG TPA: glycosyltransferase family 87 protein [Xanthobacteraceae bacterium]|nr:glycosyltransferase family 87 protein [Xanthobacteraceae bacterium]
MLRSGDWLTRERVRFVAAALLIASAAGFLFLVVTAHNDVDLQGRPLGTDFSNVYAAGTYALDGDVNAAFDPPQQFAREQAIFGATTQFYGWHYPPYFLFIAAPLAALPYGLALALWQTATLGLYVLMMWGMKSWSSIPDGRLAASGMTAEWLLLSLAFPAVLINIGHGQNGFLTAALMGGALVLLDRRPLVAGILFGLLVYKPQYGLLLPVVLGLSGRWKCFAAAAATLVVLSIATTLAFGTSVWGAFLESTHFTRTVVLEQGNTGWYKIQSVFAWARMWGAPIPIAYALQGIATLAIAVALARLWRSAAPFALQAAALCLATILATPYSFDYDMMVLAPAIAFLAVDGIIRGFGPWEKTLLAALWLMPLVARSIALATFVPLGVPVMLAVFVLILRRSEVFAAPMKFSTASAKMTGKRHDIAALKS